MKGRHVHVDLIRDEAATMPAFPNPSAVRSLKLWFCKYKTLASLSALRRLQTLVIAGFPDAGLEILGGCSELRYLQIVHLPHIFDLSPLSDLQALEILSLETLPSWDAGGKVTKVRSLAPLTGLTNLKYLSLFGIVPDDRSLAPLEECRGLVSARFSKYPKSEVARFYGATALSDAHVPEPVFDGG